VSRERVVRAALPAYPPDVRERLGEEMTATVLEASAGSRARFIRELAGLVRGGLRLRGERTAAAGARRVLADALCLAGVWVMTLDLSTLAAQTARGLHDPLLAPWSLALLGAALVLALVGFDRYAGVAALAWTAARFPSLLDHRPGMAVAVAAATLPAVAGFAALALAPRRRAPDPRRLGWLLVPVTLVATFGPPKDDQSPVLFAVVAVAALLVILFALATLTTDPRIAIAAAIPLSTITLGTPSAGLLALVAPVVLAIAVVRLRHLRRPAPI